MRCFATCYRNKLCAVIEQTDLTLRTYSYKLTTTTTAAAAAAVASPTTAKSAAAKPSVGTDPAAEKSTASLKSMQLVEDTEHVFCHPFTMTVSAPTGSGKTFLILHLLKENRVFPMPERIVLLYKRWQPLYDQFRNSLTNIEFMQGVPRHLDTDHFFDKTKTNLIIMDDLMASTANNAAVADLFTEGSHHRNLSVINLTHNLFPVGKNATTQRRNTQYMIVFKSPMSQDQIRTLGTFMFPGRLPEFMNIYRMATDKPYGYLVIDAKPDTPDDQRFKHNILSIKEKQELKSTQSVLKRQASDNNKMVSCNECGLMFEDVYDLQRHIKNWCPELCAKKAKNGCRYCS